MHNLAFILFVVAVPAHIYLGTLANPGLLRIMINGTVPLAVAKKRYPKWMKETGNVKISLPEIKKPRFPYRKRGFFFSGSACFLTCPHFIVLDLGNWPDIRQNIAFP